MSGIRPSMTTAAHIAARAVHSSGASRVTTRGVPLSQKPRGSAPALSQVHQMNQQGPSFVTGAGHSSQGSPSGRNERSFMSAADLRSDSGVAPRGQRAARFTADQGDGRLRNLIGPQGMMANLVTGQSRQAVNSTVPYVKSGIKNEKPVQSKGIKGKMASMVSAIQGKLTRGGSGEYGKFK